MELEKETHPYLSVVIPVYGCRAALFELHRRLTLVLEEAVASYEIVLVDDCCPQNSWEDIQLICSGDKRVKGVHLSRNFGQIRAITAGLDHCSGDWVVVMDCDLQDRPEAIPQLLAKAEEGYDVVFVRRGDRKDTAVTKFLSRSFYKVYDYFTEGTFDSSICNFSLSKRIVIDNYCRMREHHRGYTIFIKWLGFKQAAIEIEGDERYEGDSSYNLKRKINLAFEMITSQSNKPLKFAVSCGFTISLLSAVYLLLLIIRYCAGLNAPVGWASTIASIYLMGGLILASIGVVGLYVGNIFTEVKSRPLYVVAETLNVEDDLLED